MMIHSRGGGLGQQEGGGATDDHDDDDERWVSMMTCVSMLPSCTVR